MGDSACRPACRSCGRELVPDENAPDRGRGRSYWRRACACVIEREPEHADLFSDAEVERFRRLLIDRGCDDRIDDALAKRLLNSLAHLGTELVFGLPDHDVVVTAEEAAALLGRDLRVSANGGES
ncbi:MAG: hypothetical protein ACRDYF_00940 [Acidimicrobiia bacterium]